jgi:hypothetical protein
LDPGVENTLAVDKKTAQVKNNQNSNLAALNNKAMIKVHMDWPRLMVQLSTFSHQVPAWVTCPGRLGRYDTKRFISTCAVLPNVAKKQEC